MIQDITGATIDVGDYVVYPQLSGSSVQMVIAEVVSFHASGKVRLKRLSGSRWQPWYTSYEYIDSRSGEEINVYTSDEHISRSPGYEFCNTSGEIVFMKSSEYYQLRWHQREMLGAKYRPMEYKDYVQKVEKPSTYVYISNVKNLIKIYPCGVRDDLL